MIKITDTHSIDEYLALLEESLTVYVDYHRLESSLIDAQYRAADLENVAILNMRIDTQGRCASIDKDTMLSYFEMEGLDLDKWCRNRKVKSYSIDQKKVIQKLIDNGLLLDVLVPYVKARSFESHRDFLRKRMLEVTNGMADLRTRDDGLLLAQFPTTVQERDNFRTYYKDIAVVSIPKTYCNIVCTPSSDYFIASVDFPSADWRSAYDLFISSEENDRVIEGLDDAYSWVPAIVQGSEFSIDAFKQKRKEYKTDCLSVFYLSKDKTEISNMYRDFFQSSPRYKKFVSKIYALQRLGMPVPVTSYFGFEQIIPPYTIPDQFASKVANTPIQTMTSHLVCETTFGVLDKFYKLGYTKEDINVYFNRHDEVLFLCKKTILKDAWVFGDCSTIHIDGFKNIPLEFHFGYHYTEDDQQLTETINHAIAMNQDKMTSYPAGEKHEYDPLPSIVRIDLDIYSVKGIVKITCRDYIEHTETEYDLGIPMPESMSSVDFIMEQVMPKVLEIYDNPVYMIVDVGTLCLDPTIINETYVKFEMSAR